MKISETQTYIVKQVPTFYFKNTLILTKVTDRNRALIRQDVSVQNALISFRFYSVMQRLKVLVCQTQ